MGTVGLSPCPIGDILTEVLTGTLPTKFAKRRRGIRPTVPLGDANDSNVNKFVLPGRNTKFENVMKIH